MTRFAERILLVLLCLSTTHCHRPPRESGLIAHQAYLWQRNWNVEVTDSVAECGRHFQRLVVLAGEISWHDGAPRLTRIQPSYTALRALGQPVGLALRIGAFSGPFESTDATTRFLIDTALGLRDEAASAGVRIGELQLDFDCAERRLDGYRIWVEAIRRNVAPTPLEITALPAWLSQPTFGSLAHAADGFVLQVHSLARPRSLADPFQLCDPDAARRAVERAARFGVPFRVALPTYGYLVAFDRSGRFLGASAEASMPAWPGDTELRELRADPVGMAQLIAAWNEDRPALLRGVLWYRLPVAGDRLNWRWSTLNVVMSGRAPEARLDATAQQTAPRLHEIVLRNDGSADFSGPVGVGVRWSSGVCVAADGIRGFRRASPGPGDLLFTNAICRLPSGDSISIGWLRLDADSSVMVDPMAAGTPELR